MLARILLGAILALLLVAPLLSAFAQEVIPPAQEVDPLTELLLELGIPAGWAALIVALLTLATVIGRLIPEHLEGWLGTLRGALKRIGGLGTPDRE
jgi:hypothetical protein